MGCWEMGLQEDNLYEPNVPFDGVLSTSFVNSRAAATGRADRSDAVRERTSQLNSSWRGSSGIARRWKLESGLVSSTVWYWGTNPNIPCDGKSQVWLANEFNSDGGQYSFMLDVDDRQVDISSFSLNDNEDRARHQLQ